MFLCLPIIDQDLSILSILSRLLLGGVHHLEYRLRLPKNAVHFLKCAICGFGVEEIGNRDDECFAGKDR
jgi:hypothetical protein